MIEVGIVTERDRIQIVEKTTKFFILNLCSPGDQNLNDVNVWFSTVDTWPEKFSQ